MIRTALAFLILLCTSLPLLAQDKPWTFVKKSTRQETIRATLKASGRPDLEGGWYWIGPFDNAGKIGFDKEYPPETEIDLKKSYEGRDGKVEWKEYKNFELGKVVDLKKIIPKSDDAVVYLYREIELAGREPELMPLKLGSDDSISVWVNGKRMLHGDYVRPAGPDQDEVELALKPGKNQLLIKVGNAAGDYAVYVNPELPKSTPQKIITQLDKAFERGGSSARLGSGAEAVHYRMVTVQQPADCVLEVGGLAFRPDGKLLACTRRGEVWLIHNPLEEDPAKLKFTKYATGLHESLGLSVDGNRAVYVCQRPELTKLVDTTGRDVADEFTTICDKWGCSGDYHEFVFGPARDKEGNFYVTLNVGFGGGHQAKSPWRGWCVKISPKGDMEPFAYGLRSPNGVNFSPDGELFYSDNQGEWVASNKLHHLQKGEFYGHQASLVWLKDSPFAKLGHDTVPSGMLYDGQKGTAANAPSGFPELTPPCVWFPYGRMGQSVTEPIWDTTGGKFGPFAGQIFVGDQNTSVVMRVALEKVNGKYQGACFPFRRGFQCGVNRLAFAPDGSLFAGQTDRGWGSVGGKPYGLQRLVYTGVLPFEIHEMHLTHEGFELTFTKPLDAATAIADNFGVKSFTYEYHSGYGCPEIDTRAEKVTGVTIAPDRRSVKIAVPNLKRGRIYDFHLGAVASDAKDALVHADAYYTLNELK